MGTEFLGFPQATTQFLADLEQNNDRDWFNRNRDRFEQEVMTPARLFIQAMGERLASIAPGIQAIPKTDKSIFRLHRDTRFSADKRPFKTNLGLYFWEGSGPKMDCPGFYFHLEKDLMLVGGGKYIMDPGQMERYRAAVDHDRTGPELEAILQEAGPWYGEPLQDDAFKRVPRGFAQDHPRAGLLKRKGLTLGEQSPIPAWVYTPEVMDQVFDRFARMLPLHLWLLRNVCT